MSKDIRYNEEATQSVLKGINAVADIVKTTVGPSGRNVLIREHISPPIITNDGATIAKSIVLKDNTEDAAAQLIISAANNTNKVAGDGTTTTTILTQEIIKKYFELSEGLNINVVKTKKEMTVAAQFLSDFIKSIAIPVENINDIKRVATISSGDNQIGELISLAFDTAGEYGSVIVEYSKTGIDSLRNIQGMKLPNGMVNQFLFSDRANRKTDMKDVDILVVKEKIDNFTDIIPVLDDCLRSQRKLLILCDDVSLEVISQIVNNKIRGAQLNVSIVRLPGFGALRENMIEDICLATGAEVISRENNTTLKGYTSDFLGQAEQITITDEDTIIKFKDIFDNQTKQINLLEQRQQKAKELEISLSQAKQEDKEQYKRRIANLISGISLIEVGGNSDVEIKDKKLRIEDAINSVQAAKEEGIVPGGGFSFLTAYMNAHRDNTFGENVIFESLKAVTAQIAENAGTDGTEVVNNCIDKKLGYNALTGEYENLIETGVINSAKVDRYSLLNAASTAATVITMCATIVEENEKDQNIFQLQAAGIPGMM